MEVEDFADWLQSISPIRFNEFRDGLKRKDGRSWPRDATTFAKKSAYLLPVIEFLNVQGSTVKGQELTRILIKHAKRNIR